MYSTFAQKRSWRKADELNFQLAAALLRGAHKRGQLHMLAALRSLPAIVHPHPLS